MKIKKIKLERELAIMMSAIDIIGLSLVLVMAFMIQVISHELPCPLCLLQRIGLLGMAFGATLNLQFGLRPSHYALSFLSALYLVIVACRQILLHIAPDDSGYGMAIAGLHLYTWSCLLGIGFIAWTVFGMLLDHQFTEKPYSIYHLFDKKKAVKRLAQCLMLCVIALSAINAVTTFLECGVSQCPDNPTQYRYAEQYPRSH